MTLEYRKLTPSEIAAELTNLPDWSLEGDQITRTVTFDSYAKGPDFAVRVGQVAEALNHHPDILITWCKVKISVNTHDVGGISPYDFELARRIDSL